MKEKPIHPKMIEWNESRRIMLDEQQVGQLFEDGATTQEISIYLGCSTFPVKRVLKKLGLRRPAKRRPGVGAGSNSPKWKGGRRIRLDGYVVVWTPNGERLEHQIIMERYLGRPLQAGEIVHHLDGNKQNNDIGNLRLMAQAEHASIHWRKSITLRGGHVGRHNPRAKLTDEQVLTIRDSKESSTKLARFYGVHPSTIQRIKNGTGWNYGA